MTTRLRDLAAGFARALPSSSHPPSQEGAGKAGRRLAPAIHALKNAHGWTTGEAESTGLPCADGFTAYFVLSPGRRALLPPSSCGWLIPASGRTRGITATLGAVPGARTTRLRRRAHPRRVIDGWRALAIEADLGRCQRRVVPRRGLLTGSPPCKPALRADAVAATASRPASRDDRETPLVAGQDARNMRHIRISVNKNIFTQRA